MSCNRENLAGLPLHPVEGLALWDLSDSSYPYLGYLLVELGFLKTVVGVEETISVMALVCPDAKGQVFTPVIIGTNASLFRWLAELCEDPFTLCVLGLTASYRNLLTQRVKMTP